MHMRVPVIYFKKALPFQRKHILDLYGPAEIRMIDMREHGLPCFCPLMINSIQVVLHYLSYAVATPWLYHILYINGPHMQRLSFIGICDLFSLHYQEFSLLLEQRPVFL